MTDVPFDSVTQWINLAQPRLGAQAIQCSDDFFAPMNRMLQPEDPVFIPGKYDENGKWMDGWESRRKRGPGHDWCIVRLGLPGVLHAIEYDTRHFTGNYAPAASLEGCFLTHGDPDGTTEWFMIAKPVSLSGDDRRVIAIEATQPVSHVRLNIFPDGGMARLRLYGVPQVNWSSQDGPEDLVDLAALVNGGRPVAANDAHFGSPENLLAPGRGVNMGDGWETRRRREPGNDWCIIQLGCPGLIEAAHVDTAHFKGNFPAACSLQAAYMPPSTDEALITQSMFWPEIMPQQPLSMDAEHQFSVAGLEAVTHVRFNIFPDGGVSRLRLMGRPKL